MNDQSKLNSADIVRFYLDAGVDTALLDDPINRLLETPVSIEVKSKLQLEGRQLPTPHVAPIHEVPDLTSIQTLEDLKAAIEGYNGCGLKKTATQVVFSDGVAGSKVMLIGEAPGREEDMTGKPFGGKHGQLLDLMLKAIGLDRTQVYIANTIYWRTPGNRPPTAEETAQCLPFVLRQIELAKPKLLVTIGAVSTKTLLNSQAGIMQLRGAWSGINLPALGELPLLPTLHPSYLLRNPAHKRLAWADWLSLKMKLKNL